MNFAAMQVAEGYGFDGPVVATTRVHGGEAGPLPGLPAEGVLRVGPGVAAAHLNGGPHLPRLAGGLRAPGPDPPGPERPTTPRPSGPAGTGTRSVVDGLRPGGDTWRWRPRDQRLQLFDEPGKVPTSGPSTSEKRRSTYDIAEDRSDLYPLNLIRRALLASTASELRDYSAEAQSGGPPDSGRSPAPDARAGRGRRRRSESIKARHRRGVEGPAVGARPEHPEVSTPAAPTGTAQRHFGRRGVGRSPRKNRLTAEEELSLGSPPWRRPPTWRTTPRGASAGPGWLNAPGGGEGGAGRAADVRPGLVDFVMRQFAEDELDPNGRPAGPRPAAGGRLLLGPILRVSNRVVQAPSLLPGWRSSACCSRPWSSTRSEILMCRLEQGMDKAPTRSTFTDAADCYFGNTDPDYARHLTATAATKAEARCLRKALQLKGIAAEEKTSWCRPPRRPWTA
jgi:hypothetical protein